MIEKSPELALAKDRNPVKRRRRVLDRLYAQLYKAERSLAVYGGRETFEELMIRSEKNRQKRDVILGRIARVTDMEVANV